MPVILLTASIMAFGIYSAVLVAGCAFGNGAVAAIVFRLAGWNSAELLRAYATGKNRLYPPVWPMALMKVSGCEWRLSMALNYES